jgi:hypothetical protein
VLLALGAGIGDKIALVEPFRPAEHRFGDRNVVIEGERFHGPGRGRRDRGEAAGELGTRPRLDRRGELEHHVVEHADMVVVVARGPRHEEIGHPP